MSVCRARLHPPLFYHVLISEFRIRDATTAETNTIPVLSHPRFLLSSNSRSSLMKISLVAVTQSSWQTDKQTAVMAFLGSGARCGISKCFLRAWISPCRALQKSCLPLSSIQCTGQQSLQEKMKCSRMRSSANQKHVAKSNQEGRCWR